MAKEVAVADNAATKKEKSPKVAGNTGKNPKPSLGSRLMNYFSGVRVELKRVVWPSRQEVINSSMVVIVTLVFFAVFAFIVDTGASAAIVALAKLGG